MSLRSNTIASSLLAVLLPGCAATVESPAPRATEPAASDRHEPRVALFRQQLEADRERLGIPGLSAAIVEDGEVLWTEGFGHADVARVVRLDILDSGETVPGTRIDDGSSATPGMNDR